MSKKDELKDAKHLESVEIDVKGTITAGTTVAEMDKANVRKNRLRLGE